DVDHSNAGVHIGDPRDLVFEPIQLAVYRLGVLMWTKVAAALAEITDRQKVRRDGHRVIFMRDVEHVRLALLALPALFTQFVGDERVLPGQTVALPAGHRVVHDWRDRVWAPSRWRGVERPGDRRLGGIRDVEAGDVAAALPV